MESHVLPQIVPIAILTLISISFFTLALCGVLFCRGRRLLVVNFVFWCQPLLILLSLHATWAVAWLILGHVPRPYFDDPKSISDWLSIPYLLTFVLGCGAFSMLPGTALLSFWFVLQREWSRGRAARYLGVFLLLWGGLWLYVVIDPLVVIKWYFD